MHISQTKLQQRQDVMLTQLSFAIFKCVYQVHTLTGSSGSMGMKTTSNSWETKRGSKTLLSPEVWKATHLTNMCLKEVRQRISMNHDFSCCSLDGVQKGVRIKVCPKHRYHKMACSMVCSKSLLTNVYKTWFIEL